VSVNCIGVVSMFYYLWIIKIIYFDPPAEPLDRDGLKGDAWVGRVLCFEGPVNGSFGIRLPKRVATQIASDFLGAEADELNEQQVADVTGELANMVCGNVLGHAYAEQAFTLSTPVEGEVPADVRCSEFAWDDGLLETWVKAA